MAAQDIGVAYVHVEPSGKGFGKSIEGDIGDAVNKASKKSSSTLISKIGGAFGKIGKVGTGAIATLAGGITALAAKGGFTRALNIENAQAKLKGLGHDSASVTEIMNDALASVKGTAFGLGDAATVAASLSASGIKEGDQLTKVLKTVADTAQISGRSLTDIGTIFGSVAARGKLQGDDMLQLMSSGIPVLQMLGKHLNKTSAEVSDMVSDGKIDFQTFADAMQEGLGGAAQSAGTTFTGALANVKAALSRLGETAATPVLNGLRGLFNQAIPLIDAFTAAVSPTLEKVGVGLQKGLEQAIPTVTAFFDKLGKSQTVQQFASYLASLKDDLKELGSSLSGAAGAVWNVISEPLSELYNQAKGQLPAVADGFKTLLHAVSGLLDYMSAHADAIIPLAKGITALILASKGISAVSAGLKTVSGGLKAISATASGVEKTATAAFDMIGKISDAGNAAGALKQLAGSFNIVKAAQSAWSAVTKAATAVQLAFSAALDANPFILVIAGITAVVAALTWFFTQTETGKQLWNSFATWFTGIWNQISTACQPALQAIGTFITQTMSQIQQIWQTGWTLITTILQNVWNTIGPIIMTALTAIITGIQTFITTITPLLQAGIQNIQTIFQTATTIISTVWNGLWNTISTVVQGAWTIITTIINTALTVIQDIIQLALAVVNGNWSAAWSAIQGIASAVWGGIQGVVAAGVGMVSGVVSAACSTIRSVWAALWNGVGSIVSNVWGGIVGTVSNMVGRVGSVVSGIGGTVRSAVSGAGSWLVSAGRNIIQGLINGITGMVGSLYSSITNALSGLVDKAKNALGIHSPSRVFRDEVGVMVGRGMALGIDDSAHVVSRSMDSLVSTMSLSDVDWSKTGRLNVTAGTGANAGDGDLRELIAAVESLHSDLGSIIARYTPTIGDRDFARKVRSAIA
ncbi:tape measure protein [Bifidobacterium pseudocatenulatum]|jgi:tape measure domain-containing protein|uniref:tape measure protein n=1 Tax=Bifidobacterium pseudocatenulatum TaxID=28026 RepID=UPI0022E141FA|nr:tape measure protein [Bifidobacterium pseudocatenulatum]